ncbi:MAG: putative dehydrogenase [Pirellulaceae bacterium]|jgi:predicted dehydrogenase
MTTVTAKSPKVFRAALIGSGRICEQHMSYLQDSKIATPVAMCDLSPTMARFMADRFGVAETFTDYRAMLDRVQPDVVHILTPPHTHVRIANACLESGAHVICEKPVAPSREEFHQLWQLAQDKGLWLVEDHNYRFNEPILAIERLIADGKLGEVRDVDVRMNLGIRDGGRYADRNLPHPSHQMPAGVVHEFLTHLCYLALNFTPPPPNSDQPFDSTSALWRNRGGGDLFKFDDLEAVVTSGLVSARIRFDCHSKPDGFTVTVRGTKGMAHTDLFQPHVLEFIPRKGPAALSPVINQRVNGKILHTAGWTNFWNKVLQKTPYEGLTTFLTRTYDAMSVGQPAPVDFAHIDRAMQLIDSLLEHAKQPAEVEV